MSMMTCRCGAVMSDVQTPCPTEGALLLRDQEREALEEAASRDVVAFLSAVHSGQRAAWIRDFFSADPDYPTDLSDEDIVKDIIDLHDAKQMLRVSECGKCGRLWVQAAPGVNSYRCYTPEEPGYAAVLRGRPRGAAERF